MHRSHPLVGRIYDVRKNAFISVADMEQAIASADFIYAGERHDNGDHHVGQALILKQAAAHGKNGQKVAVVFEHITTAQENALAEALQHTPPGANAYTAIGTAVQWQERGWPAPALYKDILNQLPQPLFQATAGSLPKPLIREISRGNSNKIPHKVQETINKAHGNRFRPAIVQDIIAAHCNMLPAAYATPMAIAQQTKDAYMAVRMATNQANHKIGKTVLIAGNGHTRRDMGVPAYAQALAPKAQHLSISFLEVQPTQTDPASYAIATENAETPPKATMADIILFTPRVDNITACERMQRMMQHHRKAATPSQAPPQPPAPQP
jgi:uncharacterized iron-regulated protein